jgi:rare lipoprotein A
MHMLRRNAARLLSGAIVSLAFIVPPMTAHADSAAQSGKRIQQGEASWYGPGFHGKRTANGERFDTNAFTAAHRTLPFGTKVRVKNKKTGKSVVVRINDRGPYAHGRVIDLSKASAQAVGITGVGAVEISQL